MSLVLAALSLNGSLAVSAPRCVSLFEPAAEATSSLEVEALKFLDQLGLKNGEGEIPSVNGAYRWKLEKELQIADGKTLLLMKLAQFQNGSEIGLAPEFDVIVKDGQQLRAFEDVYEIPSSMVVKISAKDFETRPESIRNIFYYVELNDRSSIIAAMKSLATSQRYHGFSGVVIDGGKAHFDPTPGRTWRVLGGTFDLRRGVTAEVGDIQSYQLDGDFNAYFDGALKAKAPNGVEGAWVAPWGQSAVVSLVSTSPPKPVTQYMLNVKTNADFSKALEDLTKLTRKYGGKVSHRLQLLKIIGIDLNEDGARAIRKLNWIQSFREEGSVNSAN